MAAAADALRLPGYAPTFFRRARPAQGLNHPLKALKWGEWAAKPQSQNSFKPGATAPPPWRTAVTGRREGFALRRLAGLKPVICCG